MNWIERKKLAEQRAKTLSDMQAMLGKATDEKRDLSADEDKSFADLNTRAESLGKQIERYDLLAALAGKGQGEQRNQAGREDIDANRGDQDEQAQESRAQFNEWIRSGTLPSAETRAVTIDGAGVVGVREFRTTLVDKMKSFVGVRQAGAEVITTSNANELGAPTGDDTGNTGEMLGEGVATEETDVSPTISYAALRGYKFYSKPVPVSVEMLRDAAFDVEAYITAKGAERISRAFNTYSTTGTGTAQPQGVIAAATVGKTAAATNAITYEELLDLVHSVDPAYRQSPTFGLMLHDTTLAAIRKLQDTEGHYIWAAGAPGAPLAILGYRYTVNNAMAELSSGAESLVVAAGDFSKYLIRDVASPLVIRDPYTKANAGMVLFHVYSFHDGRLLDASAVKTLALAEAAGG